MTRIDVGDVLYGYCGGEFGSRSYDDKRVEAVGTDWCVAREMDSGAPVFALATPSELAQYTVLEPLGSDHGQAPGPG